MTTRSLSGAPGRQAGAIAVVIPCYQVADTIAGVLAAMGPEIFRIFCVDDASTDDTAAIVAAAIREDPRIRLISRPRNGGVGAATMDGYRAAVAAGAEVIVKLDGDGQMNPAFIADFAAPVLGGEADYVKGNRFFFLDNLSRMPRARVLGNAGLSFLTKLTTGYWDLFDPANGFTAIHASIAATLPFERIHNRYFFESDLLFRLGVIRARVIELPMETVYVGAISGLSVTRCLLTFPFLHLRNLFKRILYNYFLRNFSLASVNLVAGLLLCGFGAGYGVDQWLETARTGVPATAGTVMLSALPFLVGVQMLFGFLAHDIAMTPREAVHRRIARVRLLESRQAAE